MAEEYREYTKRFTTLLGSKCTWPSHLLNDPAKQPLVFASASEFLDTMRRGNHLDQILVLPGGVQSLGQGDALNKNLSEALSRSTSAVEALRSLGSDNLTELKGNLYIQTRPDDPNAGCLDDSIKGKCGDDCLATRLASLDAHPQELHGSVYAAEVRRVKKERGPGGKWRKSTLSYTMRERLGMDDMIYWDDYSEGLFIGGHNTAYSLHVDQLCTSNVGTQFFGHKLVAIWAHPDGTREVLDAHHRSVFAAPLSPAQQAALSKACCIALVPPGAVSVFSGVNAHATCNLGFSAPGEADTLPAPTLCVNSYEAFVNVNEAHVRAMIATNTSPFHHEDFWLDDDDLDDFQYDVRQQIKEMRSQLAAGSLCHRSAALAAEAIAVAADWSSSRETPAEPQPQSRVRKQPGSQNFSVRTVKPRKLTRSRDGLEIKDGLLQPRPN